MMKKIHILSFLIVFLSSNALANKVECPRGMMTTQIMLGKVEGWEAYVDELNSRHSLETITFFDQHPKEMASLAPDNENTKGNKLTWTFGPKQEIWLVCKYKNTKVELIKKLPADVKSCTVSYASQQFTVNSDVESMDCK